MIDEKRDMKVFTSMNELQELYFPISTKEKKDNEKMSNPKLFHVALCDYFMEELSKELSK